MILHNQKSYYHQVIHPWNKFFSLDAFRHDQDLVISGKQEGDKFFLQPCGVTKKCQGSICYQHFDQIHNLGKIYETQFLMDEKSLRVNYQGEDKCTALLKYSAEIRYLISFTAACLFIFYSVFHCGVYCRAVGVTDNLSTKQA